MELKTHNLKEFKKAARQFALALTPLASLATVVGLYGNLGSGKTTFAQEVGRALRVTDRMQSPTFLIFKKYQLSVTSSRYQSLIHVDAYRLKNSDELRKLRFDELLRNPKNLILVEWADKVAGVLPRDHTKLSFECIDENTRKITVVN